MKNILFLGQIPPPFHGQSIMIEKILKAKLEDVNLLHVPLDFSRELKDVGKFNYSKIIGLIRVIIGVIKIFLTQSVDSVYYPPAGHSRVPVYRDIIILSIIRFFKKPIIFHFHALGLFEFYKNSNFFIQWAMRRVYNSPNCAVCIGHMNVVDIDFIKPQRIVMIPYGVEDMSQNVASNRGKRMESTLKLLYLGNIYESKGVSILLDVANLLDAEGFDFEMNFVGGFKSSTYEREVRSHKAIESGKVQFLGILTGQSKWEMFNDSDIFCFPTYYENENFPVVLLEAMSFGLPAIVSSWRSIPEIVLHNETGLVVDSYEPEEYKNAILKLIQEPELLETYSRKARNRYLREYTEEQYCMKFQKLFTGV